MGGVARDVLVVSWVLLLTQLLGETRLDQVASTRERYNNATDGGGVQHYIMLIIIIRLLAGSVTRLSSEMLGCLEGASLKG